jgi:DNA repair exonuclease SbcCD nuclease subunit
MPLLLGEILDMAVARFLQISDLHLGAPLGWLPPERRTERRRDQRQALERVVSEAIERGVNGILVAGDLFDQEGVDADSLAFALHAFKVAGCPPVFISPGNHDPFSNTSVYWSPRLLKARGFAWPDHVHVFTTTEWSRKAVPGLEGVNVWGRCFTPSVESAERQLAAAAMAKIAPEAKEGLHIGLFHGSREGKCPPGQKVTAPFSDAEAQASPFAYLAIGHYHVSTRLDAHDSKAGGTRLAYAGSAVALDMTEIGLHGALEVRIELGGDKPFVENDLVQLDDRTVHEIEADVTAASSAEEVDRRIVGALSSAGVDEKDMAVVRLRGRMVKGVRYTGPGADLASHAFYLRVDLRNVRPDYDLEFYRRSDASTTEERFAKAMLDRLDAEKSPRERAILESALYYGLDAFRLREVVPVYEELGE